MTIRSILELHCIALLACQNRQKVRIWKSYESPMWGSRRS